MATLQELSAKVAELTETVNQEQAEIANAITALQTEIDRLTGLVTDGGTAEDRQAVIDNLTALKTDLEGTIAPPPVEPPQ